MTTTILKPLDSGLYTNGKGVWNFYPHTVFPGANVEARKGVRGGDTNGITVQVAAGSERTRNSNEYSTATAVLSFIGEKTTTVSVTAVQLSNLILSASVMGKEEKQSQAAASGVTVALDEPGVWLMRHYSITNVTVTDATDEPAVIGDDYILDAVSGQIETLKSGLTITYDAPEISTGFITGIAAGDGIRGTLTFRGVNAQGRRVQVMLYDVVLRPTGALDLVVDGEEEQVVELQGTAYPVTGQPAGMAIGWMRDITDETVA